MYVNYSKKTRHTGIFSNLAKRLCQVLFVLIYTLLLLPYAQATTVQHLNNSGRTETSSETKKAPKPQPEASTAKAVANPKLKLSTRISNVQLAGVPSVSNINQSLATNTGNFAQSPPSEFNAPSASARGAIPNNNTGLQYQAKKIEVEQELEHENRLLLGLMLIFVTGLLITYFISRYRPLL